MDRAGAPELMTGPGAWNEAEELEDLAHGDLGSHLFEIDRRHDLSERTEKRNPYLLLCGFRSRKCYAGIAGKPGNLRENRDFCGQKHPQILLRRLQ